jgi:hypothetical protein
LHTNTLFDFSIKISTAAINNPWSALPGFHRDRGRGLSLRPMFRAESMKGDVCRAGQ